MLDAVYDFEYVLFIFTETVINAVWTLLYYILPCIPADYVELNLTWTTLHAVQP